MAGSIKLGEDLSWEALSSASRETRWRFSLSSPKLASVRYKEDNGCSLVNFDYLEDILRKSLID